MANDRDQDNNSNVVVYVDFSKNTNDKSLRTEITGEAVIALDRHIEIHGGDYLTAITAALSHLVMMDEDYWTDPEVKFVLMRAEGCKDGYKIRRPYYGPEIVQD
jgi:hypothetical protein